MNVTVTGHDPQATDGNISMTYNGKLEILNRGTKVDNGAATDVRFQKISVDNTDTAEKMEFVQTEPADTPTIMQGLTLDHTDGSEVVELKQQMAEKSFNSVKFDNNAGTLTIDQQIDDGKKNTIKLSASGIDITAIADTPVTVSGSNITVTPDSMVLNCDDIQLTTAGDDNVAIASLVEDRLMKIEEAFNNHQHIGNMGAPTPINPAMMILPPEQVSMLQKLGPVTGSTKVKIAKE